MIHFDRTAGALQLTVVLCTVMLTLALQALWRNEGRRWWQALRERATQHRQARRCGRG